MEIKSSKENSICTIELEGRLDAATSPKLEKHLSSLLESEEKSFLIDFGQLDYISSVGLRVLLMTAKKSGAAGGKVVLCSMQEHVQEVFEIAGFTAIFSIFNSRDEALNSFN